MNADLNKWKCRSAILAWLLFAMASPAQSIIPEASMPVKPVEDSRPALNLDKLIQAPRPVFVYHDPGDHEAPQYPLVNRMPTPSVPKKDWTLMTPAEIFGLPPETKFGGDKKSLTDKPNDTASTLENYLMEKRLIETGTTNVGGFKSAWSFKQPGIELPDARRDAAEGNGTADKLRIFNRLMENARNSEFNAPINRGQASDQFFVPSRNLEPNPAQVAEMESFKALLQAAQPAAAPKSGGFKSPALTTTLPQPDPNLDPLPSGFNPLGGSYKSLDGSIGRPKRITPLPGLTASSLQSSSTKPDWAPKPAPWLSEAPELFVQPVRKF